MTAQEQEEKNVSEQVEQGAELSERELRGPAQKFHTRSPADSKIEMCMSTTTTHQTTLLFSQNKHRL